MRMRPAPLLRSRAGPHSKNAAAWPEELLLVLVVMGGLLILALSFHSFHTKAAERSEAMQQLRADAGIGGRRSGGGAAAGAVAAKDGGGLDEGSAAAATDNADVASDVAAVAEDAQAQLQQYCEQHFGMEWVRRWGAMARQVCSATQQLQAAGDTPGGGHSGSRSGGGSGASTVTCRSMNDTHMPAASSPHVLCDATNLRLDPSKLRRARCPRHRPGYMCTSPTYHAYERGAWAADCSWPGFSLAAFSKDHQQDIFDALVFNQPGGGADAGADADSDAGSDVGQLTATVEALPTLLVTREVREHANVYHTLTDLLNVYISLSVMGWEHTARQVLLLDMHPPGPLDMLWPVAAAGGGTRVLPAVRQAVQRPGGHPWEARLQDDAASGGSDLGGGGGPGGRLLVRRVSDLKGPVVFAHAVFVPPGYTSLLFAHLYEDSSCPLRTTLFAGFRSFVLSAFGLGDDGANLQQRGTGAAAAVLAAAGQAAADAAAGSAAGADMGDGGSSSGSGNVLTIRLISRRPTAGKAHMARQIGNEEELVQALRGLEQEGEGEEPGSGSAGGISVTLLDFAQLTVEQQLAVVQQTDILIGMHGAALAHALLMPPHAALVELWPQADGIWRCYQNFAQWSGALYRRVENRDPSRHRATPTGDVTEVDATRLAAAVRELLPLVRQRRAMRQQQQQEKHAPDLQL